MSTNEKKTLKSLRERAKEFSSLGLPFMEGREKGETDELLGQESTICDYGFLPNDKGEPYAVFIVKERSDKFYFGGEVLTDRLTQLENEGYGDAVRTEGLPILMTKKKSKNNRNYTNVEFFPE